MKEFLDILTLLVRWWFGRTEAAKAALVETINRKSEGWKNESPTDIFG